MSMTITIFINGEACQMEPGITVAAALLTQADISVLRHTAKRKEPRGIFCGMGVCHDCVVNIDGRDNVRSCMTEVTVGMRISTS